MTPDSTLTTDRAIEVLLDVELAYEAGLERLTSDDGRTGEYLGSGTGRASGPRMEGSVRWDLREHTGTTACEMFFSGVIETDDGVTIAFETLGHGAVTDPESAPSLWDASASIRFRSDDERYAWLTDRPASWHGEFDMDTYVHRYRVLRTA